jgi:hypothetical protein
METGLMNDTNELLSQGIAALKAGQKTIARDLLEQVIKQDRLNESAWLWLSGAVDTDEERQTCLQKVIAINPDNKAAQLGLQRLGSALATTNKAQRPVSELNHTVMPTSKWRVILIGVAGLVSLCILAGVAYWIFSSRPDNEAAHCISEAFESRYGKIFGLGTELEVAVNGGRNQRYQVRTQDPRKQVWIIESVYDLDAVSPLGRTTKTVVSQTALFDITTGKISMSRDLAGAFYSMGEDVSKWSLDLEKYCPNLKR